MNLHPEHLAQYCDADLKSHSCEKTNQHRLREEVGQKAQLEQSRQQQKSGGQQRHHPRQRHISRAGERRHAGESAGKNGSGRGIGSDHQVPRGAEHGECQQRQQQRVKPRDDWRAGNLGVAQRLRDVHRRKLQSGQGIANCSRASNRLYTLKQRQPALVARSGVGRRSDDRVPAVLRLVCSWSTQDRPFRR